MIDIAKVHDILAIMTSSTHNSGTDRINEVANILALEEDEVIINVQGDEPFIEHEVVQAVFDLTMQNRDNDKIMMNSCYKTMSNPEADDPNIVKLITTDDNLALYFSRAKIPYPRDHHFNDYKGHLGIYGFSRKSLEKFCNLNPAPLEEIEQLEQLRSLYYGYEIAMVEVQSRSFGIDTPQDLEKALSLYSKNEKLLNGSLKECELPLAKSHHGRATKKYS